MKGLLGHSEGPRWGPLEEIVDKGGMGVYRAVPERTSVLAHSNNSKSSGVPEKQEGN